MNPHIFHRKHFVRATLVLLSAITILQADLGNYFTLLNLKAYDALFYIKAKLSEACSEAPVVMVEIDDQTFGDRTFRIPVILWHHHFNKVIKGLADSGARVIGLDYLLPRALFDDIAPDYSRTWLGAFAYARSKGVPVITGYVETRNQQFLPHARYLQIIGPGHIGPFNLTTDADDFVRRQRLIFPSADGKRGIYNFSYLVAHTFRPDISLPSETIHIDYLPPDHSFPRYSFTDVCQKIADHDISFLKRQFQGKIVLIGSTDSLNQDCHPTPLYHLYQREHKRTHGVTIVANVIHTLLGRHFFSETAPHLRFAIYVALASLVGLFTFWERWRHIFIFSPLLVLMYGGISLACFLNYRILPLVPGIAAILLCQVVSLFYRYAVVDKEKRQIRSLFQRFLPPKVVSQLLATKDADFLKGENKRLCILFSDIRSFTQYSENKCPEEVVSRLNEYFKVMSEVVSSEGGIVDKFLGDGLMAFFGAFDDCPDPSLSGVRAALNMMTELGILNHRWQKQGEETFSIGVGIHTGEVKVGNIGSPNKMEYTIIGDAVNLASRLQDKTKVLKQAILISEDVHKDLADEMIAEDMGLEEIRGHSPTRIYALRGWENQQPEGS